MAKQSNMALQPLNVFSSIQAFEDAQRMAKVFINSPLVPQQFRGDLGSCLIAFNLANRTGADPLQVMQNIYIVKGKPAFSSSYLIACFNQCGRFSAIHYQFQGERGKDDWGCKAITTELATGEVLEGTLVTIGMAKAEGWYSKKDRYGNETSKWQTMPELMLRYRSATFLIRTYAPEIALGFYTREEAIDITEQATIVDDAPATPTTLDEVAMLAVAEQAQPEKKQAEPKTQPQPEAKPVATPEPKQAQRKKAEPKPAEPVAQPAEVQEATDVAEAQPTAEPVAEQAQPEKAKDYTSRFFENHKIAKGNE